MAKNTDADIAEIRNAFEKVYGNADAHPLYRQFVDSLETRSKAAILADIDEAARHRNQQGREQSGVAPGWHDPFMSI